MLFSLCDAIINVLGAFNLNNIGNAYLPGSGGDLEWAIDPQGNYYYRQIGTETWNAYTTLDTVTVIGHVPSIGVMVGSYNNPWTIGDNGYGSSRYSSNGSGGDYNGGGGGQLTQSEYSSFVANGYSFLKNMRYSFLTIGDRVFL